MTHAKSVLRIDASARKNGSSTRAMTDALIGQLAPENLTVRDVATGLPFVTEDWVGANFTSDGDRSDEQKSVLGLSDTLVDEIMAADTLVIGVPIYNFGIPAALKAWVDMIARVNRTFRYTDDGPKGLLSGKRAYILVASGGTVVGSEIDFATSYIRHVLGFIGITDVTFIAADQQMTKGETAMSEALLEIETA
ncbi:MAG: NAD(P)H-dependent oxidoreductase [Parasphingorhabdus sp.]|uniref:FMN-dependent NADH-azoreductase n=1 Tax=Parasphingorhabdus sp. TaxID=2709688 RepID=UPI003298CC09